MTPNDDAADDELNRLRGRVAELERQLLVAGEQLAQTRSEADHFRQIVAASPELIFLLNRRGELLFINRPSDAPAGVPAVGSYFGDGLDPQSRAAFEEAFRQACETGQTTSFQSYDARHQHWYNNSIAPIALPGSDACATVVSHNIDELKRTEEELRRVEQEVQRANSQLERRVQERTEELLDDIQKRQWTEAKLLDSEERFRIITETVPIAIVITRVSDGVVVYVNQHGANMFGEPAESLLGRKSTEFYADPADRERLIEALSHSGQVHELELWLRRADGERLLVSGSYQRMTFGGEACLLTGFVDLTKRVEQEEALDAERRLLKRLLELHERDRQLISYEIHDGIVQDMTAALMFFEASRIKLAENDPSQEAFEHGLRLLRGSIDEARRLINGLQPPVLEDEGVVAAVEALVADLRASAGLEIELVVDVGFRRLAPALEMAIYRIVQEGLNNVWHHSRSPRARVELVQRDDTIDILVQDWGIGFNPAQVSKRRYGLTGVRERARLLKGRAEINSAKGQGTSLRVELPLIDALMPSDAD